jgi:heme exporter protein D
MIWESWSDFFAMGGYALYVWGSLVVVFGCLVLEVVALGMQRRAIIARLSEAHAAGIASSAKRNRVQT